MAGAATCGNGLCASSSACQGIRRPHVLVHLRLQLLESLDRAASADPRVDGIAACADAVVCRLQIEPAVKIESRAILIKLSSHPRVVGKDEVDLRGPRQQSS